MKKLFYVLLFAALVISWKTIPEETKDYVTLSGKVINKHADFLSISSEMEAEEFYHKQIRLNADGTFKDTLNIKAGNHSYQLFYGTDYIPIYLKNGHNIGITVNGKKFNKTIAYTGRGAGVNNYLVKRYFFKELLFEKIYGKQSYVSYALNKFEFKAIINTIFTAMQKLLTSTGSKYDLDSAFVASKKAEEKELKAIYLEKYDERYYLRTALGKGVPSPKFVDYENYKTGKTSLEDFKGKYVYIDVWATWCPPCVEEIPFLEKIEKKYHGKNIVFVSLSIDSKTKGYKHWRRMIADKKMGGVQLLADKDWGSKFIKDYKITSIPRFILIDPKGNIVNSYAPKPSEKRLVTLLDSLPL